MEPLPLKEYRCDCGKLLFKGMLAIGFVEVKCRRCGRLKLMTGLVNDVFDSESCTIMLNRSGDILSSSRSANDVLGVNYIDIIGGRLEALPIAIPESVYRKFIDLGNDIYIKLKTFSGPDPVLAMLKTFNIHDRRYAILSITKKIDPGYVWDRGISGLAHDERPLVELNKEGRIAFIDDRLVAALGSDHFSEVMA